MSGAACPNCAGTIKSNTKEFIEKAGQIHGDRYDYWKTEYVKSSKKVIITCRNHGDFAQNPLSHLRGMLGCKDCAGVVSSTESFIKKSISIHGDRYDYSKVEYVDASSKVAISCKVHENFSNCRATITNIIVRNVVVNTDPRPKNLLIRQLKSTELNMIIQKWITKQLMHM